MSLKQRIIIWMGMALIIGMGLYPPWNDIVVWNDYRFEPLATRYQWIFNPPVVPPAPKEGGPRKYTWRSQLDTTRLLIQWTVVCVLFGGLAWTVGKRESK